MGGNNSTDYTKSLTFIQKLVDNNFGQIEIFRNQDGKFLMKNYRSFITGDKRFEEFKKLIQFIRNTTCSHIVPMEYIEQDHQSSVCIEYQKIFLYTEYLNFTLKGLIVNKKTLQDAQIWYCMRSLIQLVVELQKNGYKMCLSLQNVFLTLKGIPSIFMYHISNDENSQKLQQLKLQKGQNASLLNQMHQFPQQIHYEQSMYKSIGKIILQLYTMTLIDEQQFHDHNHNDNHSQLPKNSQGTKSMNNLLRILNAKNKLLSQFINHLFIINHPEQGQQLLTKLNQLQQQSRIQVSSQIRFNKFRYVVADDQKIKQTNSNHFNYFNQLRNKTQKTQGNYNLVDQANTGSNNNESVQINNKKNGRNLSNNSLMDKNRILSNNRNISLSSNNKNISLSSNNKNMNLSNNKNMSLSKINTIRTNGKITNNKNLSLALQDKQLPIQKQQLISINDLKTPISYLNINDNQNKLNLKSNQTQNNAKFFKTNTVQLKPGTCNNSSQNTQTNITMNKNPSTKIRNKLSLSSNKKSLRQSIQKKSNNCQKDFNNNIIDSKSNTNNSKSPKLQPQNKLYSQPIQITDYDMIQTSNNNEYQQIKHSSGRNKQKQSAYHQQQQHSCKISRKYITSSNQQNKENTQSNQNNSNNSNNSKLVQFFSNQMSRIKSKSNLQTINKKNITQNCSNFNKPFDTKNNKSISSIQKQNNKNNKIIADNYYEKLISNKYKLSKPLLEEQVSYNYNYKTQTNDIFKTQSNQINKYQQKQAYSIDRNQIKAINNKTMNSVNNKMDNNRSLKNSMNHLVSQASNKNMGDSRNSNLSCHSNISQSRNQKKSLSFFNSLDKQNFLQSLQLKKVQNQIKNKLITQRKDSILIMSNHTQPNQMMKSKISQKILNFSKKSFNKIEGNMNKIVEIMDYNNGNNYSLSNNMNKLRT